MCPGSLPTRREQIDGEIVGLCRVPICVAASGDGDDGTALAHFADEAGKFVDIAIFSAVQQHKRPAACAISLIVNFGIGSLDVVAAAAFDP